MVLTVKSSLVPAIFRAKTAGVGCISVAEDNVIVSNDCGSFTFSPKEITKIQEECQGVLWRKIIICADERVFSLPWVPLLRARQLLRALALVKLFNSVKPWFSGERYVSFSELQRWRKTEGDELLRRCSRISRAFLKQFLGEDFLKDFYILLDDAEKARQLWNKRFYAKASVKFWQLFADLKLSTEQQEAVLTDDDVTLVVAGAGSGKTHTLLGKIVFLVKSGLAQPEEILAVCFNVKASEELRKRVIEKLGEEIGSKINVRTFHSLGWNILKEIENKDPAVSELAKDDVKMLAWLTDCYQTILASEKDIAQSFVKFLSYHKETRTYFDFRSAREYEEYVKKVQPRTLRGELVRSYEECLIANFLFLNGIEYRYEQPYPYVADGNYRPDFYLPEHNVYIEHLAINKDGKVAPFIDAERYLNGIRWKREVHKLNNTKLIETYSWQVREGVIFEYLAEKLKEYGVDVIYTSLKRENIEKMLHELRDLGVATAFSELLLTCLNMYKSSGIKKMPRNRREECFLKIFEKVLNEYTTLLNIRKEVDFHDLIWKAIESIKTGKYIPKYKYILVDEFQDVTPALGELIKTLRDYCDGAKVFCVGDDWQSIYRFSGADISVMLDLDKKLGYTVRKFLKKSYRLNSEIAYVSSAFIQKNPRQIKKQIISVNTVKDYKIYVMKMTKIKDMSKAQGPLIRALSFVNSLAAKENEGGERASVLIVARYTENNMIREYEFLRREIELLERGLVKSFKNVYILTGGYGREKEYIRSVHSVKGLEADYVIIVGMKAGVYGFPCEIRDDPVVNLFTCDDEDFPYAEERRVFYVALTRAKRGVVILADGLSPKDGEENEVSCFLEELIKDFPGKIYGGQRCPQCGTGRLVVYLNKKTGKYFLGCARFPDCAFTANSQPRESSYRKGMHR